MFNFGNNKKITETLYAQNLELAVKNKTLSLLEKLYQTSVLTLLPKEMAEKITEVICKDLNLELTGVMVFKKNTDTLEPLALAASERLSAILQKLNFPLDGISIANAHTNDFLKNVIDKKIDGVAHSLAEIWDGLIQPEFLKEITSTSHIKTTLAYPLHTSDISGVLLLAFNRDYETLNTFEKSSIKSFVNVIALLIEKAYLYKNLQDSYEVTKRAYAIEKQAKEELQQLDKVKDQFLAQTQHDLRTPLTSIMGYSDLLLNGTFGKLTKKTTDIVKKIQLLTNGMIRKANNFLDLAQFQLGKSAVELKPGVPVFAILEEIKTELEFKAQSKQISLDLKKSPGELLIKADREKLKAAIFNIVDNSVKYTTKGGVTIELQNHDTAKIVISDTGIGIPKERVGSIFETMYDRTEQAKKTATGFGVGLYLSTQIIKAHGGKVWAESELGKGSVFHVELPLDK